MKRPTRVSRAQARSCDGGTRQSTAAAVERPAQSGTQWRRWHALCADLGLALVVGAELCRGCAGMDTGREG
ncbi:MAG: hypothetical protein GF331_10850 [Chitinivibrionales bacterium]|nr:hypothetical protein [Chitinivibrionales bacterium]